MNEQKDNEAIDLSSTKECLLSLDWEINKENIEQFQNTINYLTLNPGVDNDSQIMLEAILIILKYLKEAMFEASPLSIQILHKAVECLETLQENKSLSDSERNILKTDFLNQFDQLDFSLDEIEEETTALPEKKTSAALNEALAPSPQIKKKPVFKDGPLSFDQLLKEAKDHVAALEKAVVYFNSIKSYMENNMNRAESISRALIETTEKLQVSLTDTEKPNTYDLLDKQHTGPLPSTPKKTDLPINKEPPPTPDTDPLSLYLVRVKGVTIGIPSNAFVGSFKLSKRKALLFKQQGYATLPNLQKLFRNIKADLRGPLALKKDSVLKKMKIPLAIPSPLLIGKHNSLTTPQSKGAILLADNKLFGLLFIDDIFDQTQYPVQLFRKSLTSKDIIGVAMVQGSIGPVKIDVLNINNVLSIAAQKNRR